MIDTDKYEGCTKGPWTLEEREDDEGHQWFEVPAVSYTTKLSGDGSQQELADAQLIADAPLLLAEVRRLREENETLRKMDWEYECLWTWLDENTNLLNTIEPLVEEWKKEMIE